MAGEEYKVIRVVKLADLTPEGTFKYFYRVWFKYKDMEDFVDIPVEEYTPEKVKEKIEEIINTHKAIGL